MALSTMGSFSQTILTSKVFGGAVAPADIAGIANLIKDDLNNLHPIWPGAWAQTGLLYVPNRGVLRMLPGDYVAVDTVGWPVLVSARSAGTAASWIHNP